MEETQTPITDHPLLQGKMVLVPVQEYMALLKENSERVRMETVLDKASERVKLVQKVLGRFLTNLNANIPLEPYFERFNTSQEEVFFYVDENKRVRLSFGKQNSNSKG